ncbi:MAG: hypothetical protein JWN53_3 [Gemmatimonadetes bacterium]|nr:hypothetical protein [Gemmatimonadota bacterium]
MTSFSRVIDRLSAPANYRGWPRPRTLWRSIAVVATLSNRVSAQQPPSPRVATLACSLSQQPRGPWRLDDGRVPYVAATSVASTVAGVAVVGSPAYVWDRHSRQASQPAPHDSIIGVILRDNGAVLRIPSPLPGRSVLYPKVASNPHGRWDVIFAIGSHEDDTTTRQGDTLQLWFGEFDGVAWMNRRHLLTVAGARLRPENSSRLLRGSEGDLAFAFPIEIAKEKHAAILVHQRERAWAFDTLRTTHQVDYTALAAGSTPHSWMLVTRHDIGADTSWVPGSLFVTPYSAHWGATRLAVRARTRSLDEPVLTPVEAGFVITWSQGPETVDPLKTPLLRAVKLSELHTLVSSDAVTIGRGALEFAVGSVLHNQVVWIERPFGKNDRLRIHVGLPTDPVDAGEVMIPDSFGTAIAPIGNASLIWVGADLGHDPAQPPVQMRSTVISLHCRSVH